MKNTELFSNLYLVFCPVRTWDESNATTHSLAKSHPSALSRNLSFYWKNRTILDFLSLLHSDSTVFGNQTPVDQSFN